MDNTKQGHILTKGWVVALAAVFCCALWGSAFPGIKIGYQLLQIASGDTGSQILFAGCRFTLAGIMVVMAGSLMERRVLLPGKKNIKKILILCMLQTFIQYFFFYIGLAHTSGVKGSIIIGANSLVTILIASLIFRQEKLNTAKILGCALGLAGVVAANMKSGGMEGSFALTGEGFLLISVVSYGFSSVLIKQFSKDENPVLLSGWQFVIGGILLILTGKSLGGHISGFTAASGGVLLYLGFLSAAAYTLWGILLKYNPVSRVAIYGFTNPVFGVLLSALFLGEGGQAFSLQNVGALALVCAGVLVVNKLGEMKRG